MTPATLKKWRLSLKSHRNRRDVSQTEAADLLGVGHRTYQRWEANGIPKGEQTRTALACAAIKHDLPPYGG